jgi:hypothetical protein
MSIEHADFDGIERLALVLGGEIASTFDSPSEVGAPWQGGAAKSRGCPRDALLLTTTTARP